MNRPPQEQPKISVVILNYNGMQWLERCLDSLERQTIFDQIEVIFTDNKSSDASAEFAARWLTRCGKGPLVQNGANLYYCEANNRGAAVATGRYLLFLNQDTWLEPDCLAQLYEKSEAFGASAASPLVLDYESETLGECGGPGFDLFGLPMSQGECEEGDEIFGAPGCSLLIRADMFKKIGGFDARMLMYVDETDLSSRVWIAGGKIVGIPSARLHHRGAVMINPKGITKIVELRTSETKRYLTNRNGILFWLKNAEGLLLLILIPHLLLLAVEAAVSLLLVRRWSFVRKGYLNATADAFQLLDHVRDWRKRIKTFRQRSDFWMLRFLRIKFARWAEVRMLFRFGLPKVETK